MMPMDENYAGTAAFSEPETVAVRDFVLAHPEAVAHLDVHSFGQLILYPWGDVFEPAPDDAALSQTAAAIEAAMEATGFQDYLPIQGVDLYPASGNAIDWTYEEGLHSLTLELRPQDPEIGFVLPPDQIVPVGEEVLAAAWVLFDRAMGDVPDPTGDETGSDTTTTSTGADTTSTDDGGDPTTASATATDASASATAATTTADTQGTSGSSEGGTSDAGATGEASGCGCVTHSGAATSWGAVAWFVLALGRRRGRRRTVAQ